MIALGRALAARGHEVSVYCRLHYTPTGGASALEFLVDPAGRIARVWPRVKADGHAAAVLAALAEAKAASAR